MTSASDPLLAGGGGNATAAGVSFQAQVGAAFACQLLAERPIDPRLGLGTTLVQSLRFETEAPVDDILIETGAGHVFVQAKTSLTLSTSLESELGSIAEQIVRLCLICSRGSGARGWDRPLRSDTDRILRSAREPPQPWQMISPKPCALFRRKGPLRFRSNRGLRSTPLPI